MQEFAKHIYRSPQWKRVREYIIQRDDGLCARCGEPGNTVHHKVHLAPQNVNDPAIVYGADNLELLCEKCHGQKHQTENAAGEGFTFDTKGNLVPASTQGYPPGGC